MESNQEQYNKAMQELENIWKERTGNDFQSDRINAKMSTLIDEKESFLKICNSLNPALSVILRPEIFGK